MYGFLTVWADQAVFGSTEKKNWADYEQFFMFSRTKNIFENILASAIESYIICISFIKINNFLWLKVEYV